MDRTGEVATGRHSTRRPVKGGTIDALFECSFAFTGNAVNDFCSPNESPPGHFLRAKGPIILPAQSKGDRKGSDGLGYHPQQHKKACKADHSFPDIFFIDLDVMLSARFSKFILKRHSLVVPYP